MKAVVLVAGEGKRMRPVSDFVPKEMIPILGKPFLYYVLMRLKKAGLRDVVIVTSPKKEVLLRRAFKDGREMELKIEYVLQEQQLGPAHAILQARKLIDTEYFLVHYGDSLADKNVSKALVETQKKQVSDIVLCFREVDDPSRYGIVYFDGDRIVDVVEKPLPGTEPSRMATMGVYVMKTSTFFNCIKDASFKYGVEQFPPRYVLQAGGSAIGWKFDGRRVDLGKPEDIFKASTLVSDRPIRCMAFDADNTLYNTKNISKTSDMAAMDVLSHMIDRQKEELYEDFNRIVLQVKDSQDPKLRHRRYAYKILCQRYGIDAVDRMYDDFVRVVLCGIKLIHNIIEVLEHNKKKAMFVITEDNRKMTQDKLRTLGIDKYFRNMITSDDVGAMKPSKLFYVPLLKDFLRHEIIIVGDTYDKDLFIPAKLGMHVLLVQEAKDLEPLKSLP